MARTSDCFDGPQAACAPEDVSAPAHNNRPGLPALEYRRGTWGSILRRLEARLDSPLQGAEESGDARDLNTAAKDDPAAALLDAFSVVADVLTFYQERIANEGFVRTARERLSLSHLADAIGYRLSPGVAAGVDLAFSVDGSDKAPGVATVPKGAQVLHIPGQHETPQPFETSEELEARADWNELAVPTARAPLFVGHPTAVDAPAPAETGGQLDLSGTGTGLRQHSRLLIVYGEFDEEGRPPPWRLHRLKSVSSDPKRGLTRVTWDPNQSLGRLPPGPLDGNVEPKVYALRTTTALFGWNAPDWHTLPEAIQKTYLPQDSTHSPDWPLFDAVPALAGTAGADDAFVTDQLPAVDLAQEHGEIEPGSLLIVADVSGKRDDSVEGAASSPAVTAGPLAALYRVEATARVWRQNFRITGHATRITPSHSDKLDRFGLRESVVYAASDPLPLAQVDDPSFVGPASIEVTGEVALPQGRRVLVSGWPEGADTAGPKTVEAAVVDNCAYVAAADRSVIHFAPAAILSQRFQRAETVVRANVVAATHGKTIQSEVMGSGDGSIPFAGFSLKQGPLTYVSDAAAPTGASSSLSVRVNGVEWRRVSSLLDQDGRSLVYAAAIDEAETRVVFGDGRTGSRLPSGAENLSATYRIGIGKVGEVAAESIALMVDKPLGMRSVTNLEPSSGAEDPETAATAREQAPASVLVLDRVVSVSDYADFARGFLGIGKASASVLWDGDRRVVHLTVTDTSGNAFDANAQVFGNLREALLHWGDAEVPLVVATLDAQTTGGLPGPRRFGVKARLLVDAAHVRRDVVAAARTLLESRFSAEARNLAQQVSAAEVITVLHEVVGVIAVDLDELYLQAPGSSSASVDATAPDAGPSNRGSPANRLGSCLPAFPARVQGAGVGRLLRPAELLLIDPAAIVLLEMLP